MKNLSTLCLRALLAALCLSVAGWSQIDSQTAPGAILNDAGIQTIVSAAITSGRLPKDTSGVYFVLTSADVNETSGFCTQYCGWHTSGFISGSDIKYSFVGNGNRCPSSCTAQSNS